MGGYNSGLWELNRRSYGAEFNNQGKILKAVGAQVSLEGEVRFSCLEWNKDASKHHNPEVHLYSLQAGAMAQLKHKQKEHRGDDKRHMGSGQ